MDGNRVQKRCPNGPARNADGSKQHKLNLRSWPTAEKSGTNIYTRRIVAFWPEPGIHPMEPPSFPFDPFRPFYMPLPGYLIACPAPELTAQFIRSSYII